MSNSIKITINIQKRFDPPHHILRILHSINLIYNFILFCILHESKERRVYSVPINNIYILRQNHFDCNDDKECIKLNDV